MTRSSSSLLLPKHIYDLRILHRCKECQRRKFLKNAPHSLINCICEICFNILKGNVPLNTLQKKKLKKHTKLMRYLTLSKNRKLIGHKRSLILQEGGFLPLILTPLLTIAADLLADLIIKKK
jgi:hypothetical protein